MKSHNLFAMAVLAICTAATADAADQGEISISMIAIPGKHYEMGKFEVTQGQWKAIMGGNPSYFDSCGDNCPVERVSWDKVQEFLLKLNAHSGKQYRLPTEDEWEYACHGGSEGEYCGGSDPNVVGWFKNNSDKKTHPVGQKQANGFGLYDMSGNVCEWVQDWYDESQHEHVLRGGSWGISARDIHTVFRYDLAPSDRFSDYGFRLARTLP